MAAPVVALTNSGLSHKQRRAALKKERRKKKRQALAKLRDSEEKIATPFAFLEVGEEEEAENETLPDQDDEEEEKRAEEERQRLHLEWLERERIAQEEFRLNEEREEAIRRKKEEEERRIKEEWEEQQRKEQEEREQKQQEKREREEAVQKMLDEAESQLGNGGTWVNPEAPEDYGTEKDRENCPFFLKTGACRFGDRCSRKHTHLTSSTTMMIRGMFLTFGMEQSRRDDYDTDASLEYSEEEIFQQFLEFYEDVLPEFKTVGKVVQFKVSCNFEPHLRGNVYVQYEKEEECNEAFKLFNGRWYAGKQLQCEFSPVTRWKTALCGLFNKHKCPRGKHCNFLHVYKNPNSEFWEADRDFNVSPDRGGQFSWRLSEHRDWSRRQRSYSPESTHRRNGESDRHWSSYRSRSRERRRRQRSRSPAGARRSRSRKRRSSRSRERHRSKGRSASRSRSRGRERRRGRGPSPRSSGRRPRSRSRSGERRAKKSRSGSPGRPGGGSTRCSRSKSPRHKRTKKSKKKKSKKKKSKRRSSSPSASPSPGSKKSSEDEGGTNLALTPQHIHRDRATTPVSTDNASAAQSPQAGQCAGSDLGVPERDRGEGAEISEKLKMKNL
nr:PREDICTED: U2 small nuclear ribonucleoprotein auxiliary factor 35 kDa subunit-related protein 2 isoform X1 [Lepisosteus oculatus]